MFVTELFELLLLLPCVCTGPGSEEGFNIGVQRKAKVSSLINVKGKTLEGRYHI